MFCSLKGESYSLLSSSLLFTYHAQNENNLFLSSKDEDTGLQLWMKFLYTVLKTQLTSVLKIQINLS
jgi:hypothetical protein